MIEVIDNLIDSKSLLNLQEQISSKYFPWFFDNEKILESKNNFNFHFVHTIIKDTKSVSPIHQFIQPIFDKLSYKTILRAKINMVTKTQKLIKYDLHKDNHSEDVKIAIFYVNSTNGYTFFDNNKKIESIENRLIKFDDNILHSGTNCTDKNNRIVININYNF